MPAIFGRSGFVVSGAPQGRARVMGLPQTDSRHIFEVRRALEGLAARLAAANIDEHSQKRLQAQVDEMRQAAKAKNYLKMHNADQRFHQIIWRSSANPYLDKILSNLLSP